MKIEHYSFGRMSIGGTTYTSDLIIYPGRVDASWWRKTGHMLEVADLQEVLAARPQVLLIGTGAHGLMKVPKETRDYLESRDIEVFVQKTDKAAELFNTLQTDKTVIAAFHLTC
ncbi:MAG: Mth938-like domain-containing protein [Nitrospirota bacterium]